MLFFIYLLEKALTDVPIINLSCNWQGHFTKKTDKPLRFLLVLCCLATSASKCLSALSALIGDLLITGMMPHIG